MLTEIKVLHLEDAPLDSELLEAPLDSELLEAPLDSELLDARAGWKA